MRTRTLETGGLEEGKDNIWGGKKTHEDDGSKERKIADLSKTDVRDRNSIILLNLFHYIV